jgi:2-C-methyl-D-erythritol 4-phosphate cytidylyltransferase
LRYWLIMPAAGSGQRFGQELPKQYMPLAGRTVIECSLAPFLADSRCAGAVIAIAANDRRFGGLALAKEPRLRTVTGGQQRADSVLSALESLQAPDEDWVLVHDAARPCVSRGEIDALLLAAGTDAVGGLLAVPLSDTLKREQSGRVRETPSRESLWRALTPQMFRLGALRSALQAARDAGRSPTDEAQALEWAGQQPVLVAGSPQNIKITTAADLELAAAILLKRGEHS